jgi:hypothetical protein
VKKLISWYRAWVAKREQKKWAIPLEEAERNAVALLYEFGAEAASKYMDEWARRNGHD